MRKHPHLILVDRKALDLIYGAAVEHHFRVLSDLTTPKGKRLAAKVFRAFKKIESAMEKAKGA